MKQPLKVALAVATATSVLEAHASPAIRVYLRHGPEAIRCVEHGLIQLQLVIENIGESSVKASLVVEPVRQRYMEIWYRRAETEQPFQRLSYPESWTPPGHGLHTVDLKPAAQHSFVLSLGANPGTGAFLFPEPGRYELKGVLRRPWLPESAEQRDIEVPSLFVDVAAVDPPEQAARDAWTPNLAILAQEDGALGGPLWWNNLPSALAFMTEHSATPYARALRRPLLRFLRDNYASLSKEQQRQYAEIQARPQ